MANNKFVFEDEVLLDLTGDDLTNDTSQVMSGLKYHGKDGVQYTGTGSAGASYEINLTKPSNLSFNGTNLTWAASVLTVTVDAGWTYTSSLLYYVYVDDVLLKTVSINSCELNEIEKEVEHVVKVKSAANVTVSKIDETDKTSDSINVYIEKYSITNVVLKSETLVYEMSYSCAVSIGNKAYILGGSSENGMLDIIQEYDPESGTIVTKTTKLFEKIAYNSAAQINNKAYIFGGYIKNNEGSFSKVSYIQEYDPITNTVLKKDATLVDALELTTSCSIGNKAYIFGGIQSSGKVSYIQEYDQTTDTIVRKSCNLFDEMTNMSAVSIDGKAYIFGGYGTRYQREFIQVYDPSTNTITLGGSFSKSINSTCSVCINGKAYIFGGYTSERVNYIQEYDPITKTIKKMDATLVEAIEGACATSIGYKAYVFGGFGSSGTKINYIQEIS